MFGLGSGELIIILAIVVLVFGAKKLPQLGDGLGKALRGFKKAVNDEPAATNNPPDADARPRIADEGGKSDQA
jgi:sec-independent protein translocase protein TatA